MLVVNRLISGSPIEAVTGRISSRSLAMLGQSKIQCCPSFTEVN